MNRTACDELDDFLDGGMFGVDLRRFSEHLKQCQACRETVRLQRSVDALLLEAEGIVEVPESLVNRVELRLRLTWRLKAVARATALAASFAIVFAVWWLLRDAGSPQEVERFPVIASNGQLGGETRTPEPEQLQEIGGNIDQVTVEFLPSKEAVAVKIPTKNPEITFFFVYPTIKLSNALDPAGASM